jgi:hypothetical protein
MRHKSFVAAGLLLICLFLIPGCGGGGNPSIGSAQVIRPMGFSDRTAGRSAVIKKWKSLRNLPLRDQNTQLAAYIRTLPQFEAAGVNNGGCVWARYKDGGIFVVANNTLPSPKATGWNYRPLPPTSKVRSGVPTNKRARIMRSMGTLFPDATANISSILTKSGYDVISPAATIANLETVAGDGIFYLHGHGGAGQTRESSVNYGLWTSDLVTAANAARYEPLIASGEIFEMTANQNAPAVEGGDPIVETHYAITASFVRNHMSFGPGSFVLIHGCSGADAAFKAACIAKGASLYAGWTNVVMSDDSRRASEFVFDRMTGANHFADSLEETPQQRPFDYQAVWDDLKARGWDTSHTDWGDAKFVFAPGTTGQTGILNPSITYVAPNDVASDTQSTLTIGGMFGPDPGEDNRDVHLGALGLKVKTWAEDRIVCELPQSGSGASGDCIVTVRGHDSNKVPLTEYKAKFTYTLFGRGSQKQVVTFTNAHFRADLHPRRLKPHIAPTKPSVMFLHIVDSTAKYACSGSDGDVTWSGSGPLNAKRFSPSYSANGFNVAGQIDTATKIMKINCFAVKRNGRIEISSDGQIVRRDVATGFTSLGASPYVPVRLSSNFGIIAGSYTGKSDDYTARLVWQACTPLSPPDADEHAADAPLQLLEDLLVWATGAA